VNFQKLFKPKTIAIIGVSLKNSRHPANVIYNKIHLHYSIDAYPINPMGGYLQGEKVYKNISEIPQRVDLVIIAVRAEYVPDIMRECIKNMAGSAIIISGGFSENNRKDLQDDIVAIAKEGDFPFLGPNCLGIFSPKKLDTFFLPSERIIRPEQGNVAFVSQSGGVLVDQMIKFSEESIGLSLAVSIGNKAMIGEIELLEYLNNDPETKIIAFYIEGFKKNEGRDFVIAASKCNKPVIVLKAGKSPDGNKAVSSHTASLAGNYEVFSQVLSQYGIAEAKNEFELVSFCESLSRYQKSIKGRIGIITGSGGHGAISVDICFKYKLSIPTISQKTKEEITEKLSPNVREIASIENPIDLTGSAVDDDFVAAVNGLAKSVDIDCIIVLLLPYIPGITSDLGARLSQIAQRENKPLIAYVPHVGKYSMFIEGFELNNVPVAYSIEGAVLMVEAMRRCQKC